ncbi:MAG: hypothetical protein V4720_06385 [Pseudomonadota bacterium]
MLRHILIRRTGAMHGGDLMPYTATELCQAYSAAELSRLAIGLTVARGETRHTDLLAFHDRHTAPEGRPVVLRGLAPLGEVA